MPKPEPSLFACLPSRLPSLRDGVRLANRAPMTMTAMPRQGKNKVKWTRFRDDAFGHECTCGQRSLVSWLRLIRVGVSTAQNFAMRIESQGYSEAGIATCRSR